MEIQFSSQKTYKLFTNEKELKKRHADVPFPVVKRRLEQMAAVACLDDLHFIMDTPILHLHKLTNRKDEFAVRVTAKKRIILEPDIQHPEIENVNDLTTITHIILKNIEDYH